MKDRLKDLTRLSAEDPNKYYDPGYFDYSIIDPEVFYFLRVAETAKINLDYLRELLLILDKFQSESLSSTSDKSSKLSRSKVTEICSNFSAVVRKTQKLLNQIRPSDLALRRILPLGDKDFNFSVSWRQGEEKADIKIPRSRLQSLVRKHVNYFIPAETRMQILQYNIRSLQLKEICQEFFTMQKCYNEKSKAKIHRQMSIIQNLSKKSYAYSDDGFSPDSDDEKTPFLHSKIKDDVQIKKEMAIKLKNVEYYEKEIYTLEKNISQLYDSYVFVSTMVQDQGAIVDRVEHHVNNTADYVASGAMQVKKAKHLKDKYRTKKVVLVVLLLVLVGVVAVVVAVSVEHSVHLRHHHYHHHHDDEHHYHDDEHHHHDNEHHRHDDHPLRTDNFETY